MAWRILMGTWAALATGGLVWLMTGGELSVAQVVDGLAGLAALVALWGVVRIPWDLYFAARNVQRSQADGVAREVDVPRDERAETGRLAQRLLWVAVGLHLVGAGTCAALSWVSGGQVGWVASGAFLVTMGLRPAGAMVTHVRSRLAVLQRRAVLPSVDARTLAERLGRLHEQVATLQADLTHEETGLAAVGARLEGFEGETRRALSVQQQHHHAELDRLGLEMQRALETLTRDKEVLAGLRAFLQMVKER